MKLEKLRKNIDSIDSRILDLVNLRAKEALRIGDIKRETGAAAYVPHREKAVIQALIKKNSGKVTGNSVDAIFREIINACRSLEDSLKIAFLGPEASFSNLAALKNFGQGADYLPVHSIKDVFLEVEKGRADYGVVPVENSTEGIINHTHDMFMHSELCVCAELPLTVELYLLSKSGNMKDIKKVFSHLSPLAQCRNWLETNLPGVPVIAVSSTTEACKKAAADGSIAAVSSKAAGVLYKLETCARGIEDSQENITRFFIIGKTLAQRSGDDKTSIMVSLKDHVGALHDMLSPFKQHKINLARIESRPTGKKAWEYIFFIDFLGHVSEPRIQQVLKKLQSSCSIVKVLGSYPRAGR
jgi:chorismate mutase/prephenate dehydratase